MKSKIKVIWTVGVMATAICLLEGCDRETDDPFQGKDTPIEFNITWEGRPVSRSIIENSWGGEEIAVKVDKGVKKYTAAPDGKLQPSGGVSPFFWQAPSASVSAWYPYSATSPASFSVKADQSGNGYENSDMIYAAPQTLHFSDATHTLAFRHLPVKVVINLKRSGNDNVTEAEVKAATITMENVSLTSGTIATDGSVAQATAGTGTITPHLAATAATGYGKTVMALLPPQQMATKKFIKIGINAETYHYIPIHPDDANLESGMQYTYNITLQKKGFLSVDVGTNGLWTQGKDIDVEDDYPTEVEDESWKKGGNEDLKAAQSYTKDMLKPTDFFYSDGTHSDGGLREIDENWNATFDQTVEPIKNKTLIGLVCYVGDPTITDELLKKDHPACTHGLVMAVGGDEVMANGWGAEGVNVNAWIHDNYTPKGSWPYIDGNAFEYRFGNWGYTCTKEVEFYNEKNPGKPVYPVEAVVKYRKLVAVSGNTSGWYVPSMLEYGWIWGGRCQIQDFYIGWSEKLAPIFNIQLKRIKGKELILNSAIFYVSSLQFRSRVWGWYSSWTWYPMYYPSKSEKCRVRFILAF